MLYADDAGIVYLSASGFERMMTAIVTAWAASAHTASEAKMEIACLKTEDVGHTFAAAGQVCKQKV